MRHLACVYCYPFLTAPLDFIAVCSLFLSFFFPSWPIFKVLKVQVENGFMPWVLLISAVPPYLIDCTCVTTIIHKYYNHIHVTFLLPNMGAMCMYCTYIQYCTTAMKSQTIQNNERRHYSHVNNYICTYCTC